MLKEQIKDAITGFKKSATQNAALNLFRLLGYHSDRRVDTSSVPEFLETFDQNKQLNQKKALVSEWTNVKCLFQITDEEIKETQQGSLFEEETAYENQIIESYLFLSIDLKQDQYTRTALAQVTRAVNSLFAMPALILFRHNHHFTLSVINRRLHKKDRTRDVLEKVTLVKDVSIESPHRAHIEILHDLALPQLQQRHNCHNFVTLHNAWQKTLDSSELNKRFFQEVANWYFWAVDTVVFPMPSSVNDAEAYKAQSVIRLITRLIFCWFIKEKGLLPDAIFNPAIAPGLLKKGMPEKGKSAAKKIPVRGDESGYYKAILQNLFFATLNQEMGNREFRKDGQNFMAHTLYRYKTLLKDPEAFLALLNDVPFLNGGLFECLDKTEGTKEKPTYVRVDGFSDRTDNPLYVPDALFFGEEHAYDLNSAYGSKNKKYTVRGIIHTLNRYKFTIEENTPIEEEIALDPELLGRVFENLLAAYNPETGATARKQTGSFYTPREIVNYMVDEALVARLTDMLQESFPKAKHLEEKLRHLFSYNQEPHKFTEEETRTLIAAIDSLKILDPACGSGAFPMGVIHKLVFILSKLDPENKHWLQRQIERVNDLPDPTIRDVLIKDIERAFRENALDYGRKLFLIENCVFGVDIQPVAVQIAKLRFLISLIVEQQVHVDSPNRGIRPLPNLETKIVSADTLIPIPRPEQLEMRSPAIRQKEAALKKVRNNHFNARTPSAKATCRHQDEQLRQEIAQLLISEGWHDAIARKLSAWNPYSPNTPAGFFDPEWMFQVAEGFDVVIGNPPYIQIQRFSGKQEQIDWQRHYVTFDRKGDVYCLFYERGINLLKKKGVLAYISSNKWMRANYGSKTRKFFAENTDPFLLVDFDACKVFEGVTVNTCVLGVKKGAKHSTFPACTLGTAFSIKTDIDRFVRDHAVPMDNVSEANWLIASKQGQDLKSKIESLGIPIREWPVAIFRGILTGYNKAFILEAQQKNALIAADPRNAEIIHPVVRGKDIKRWRTDFADLWLITTFPALRLDINEYPAVRDYLGLFGKRLQQTGQPGCRKRTSNKWFEVQDTIAYYEEFQKQKIAWGNLNLDAQFGFVPAGVFVNAPSPVITPANKYLLAVLNSKVADYYIRQLGVTRNGGYFEYKPMFVEQLPVPQVSPESQEPFEDLVDQILILSQSEDYRHNTGKHAKVKEYEQEIDRLVYDLYQLTEDEIKIVEAN